MKRFTLWLLLLCGGNATWAQTTQNIKGRIIDKDSRASMIGVTVVVTGIEGKGSFSDVDGYFLVSDVPIGRHQLEFSYLGYETVVIPNVEVTSAKEVYLPVEMVEISESLGGVVVRSTSRLGTHNEMTTLSSRTFNAEEAERYPGSRQDPARMASNYAGVSGTDDSRNDIVVRGNSPLGLLWRFEGIDIPNPSHFSIAGTTGGPLSILNNKVIGNSDFMTGAFPGEYGNALSGVFDIRMRAGNRSNYEHTAQLGVLGLELMSEGPINKEKKSSYIATYRYSTFAFFEKVNFRLGTDAIPNYQDASFKLSFPNKHKGEFSVWGIGGLSAIDILFSDDVEPTNDLYGENDRDQYFRTNMFTVGVSNTAFYDNGWSSSLTLAQTGQEIIADHDFIIWDTTLSNATTMVLDTFYPVLRSRMYEGRTAIHYALNKKYSVRSRLKVGILGDYTRVNYLDSSRNEYIPNWQRKLDAKEGFGMLRMYASHKYRLSTKLTMNSGLHGLYYSLGDQFALEPRLGFNYAYNQRIKYGLAYGMHSRSQPTYAHFYRFADSLDNGANATYDNHNKDLGLSRSHHLVASMDYLISSLFRLKVETYYQYLYNIPIEPYANSTFSLINQGSGFTRFFPNRLVNEGTGENYGVEVTLEKFYSNHFFFLTSGSLYNSTYTAKDGISRNTDFNGNYILNVLGGYELPFGKGGKNRFSLGAKLTTAGGKRYSPVDQALTEADGIYVHFVDSLRNSLQFDDYFRLDVKLGFKFNSKKLTHEISIDLLNVTNHENLLAIAFANDVDYPGRKRLIEKPQLGFLPLLYYKVDF